MAEQEKLKLSQFIGGNTIMEQLENPVNIYVKCKQIPVNHAGEHTFDVSHLDIPEKGTSWRTVKLTVDGASFYEGKSFTLEDGVLQWIDNRFKLKKNETVFLEYTVNGAEENVYEVRDLNGALYTVVQDYVVAVRKDNDIKYLIVQRRDNGD